MIGTTDLIIERVDHPIELTRAKRNAFLAPLNQPSDPS